jgi:hypothetical protein
MNKFITNYTSVKEFKGLSTPATVVTEIDTPYGKGHRFTSGGPNWQWAYIKINSFLNSGVLRFIARASVDCLLNIHNDQNKIGQLSITTDWSVIESEVLKKPDKIISFYGLDEGVWVDICDAVVLSDRDSLNQLDAINVPIFKADTMPISINQGA